MITALPRLLILAVLGLLQVALPTANAQTSNHQRSGWRARLNDELPLLGHRNWIAVVDSAYPLQTSAGIETINTNDDQLDVVREVLDQLTKAKHVRPEIFTDAEIKALPDANPAR